MVKIRPNVYTQKYIENPCEIHVAKIGEHLIFFNNFADYVEWKIKHGSTNLNSAKTWNPRKNMSIQTGCVTVARGGVSKSLPLKFVCLCREDANALAWLRKLKMRNWCTWMVLQHVCNMYAVFIKWDGFRVFPKMMWEIGTKCCSKDFLVDGFLFKRNALSSLNQTLWYLCFIGRTRLQIT